MKGLGLGFGLERIALFAYQRPRVGLVTILVIIAFAAFGMTRLQFDENLRNVFATDTPSFRAYVSATQHFVDPENELLVLVEGNDLGKPEVFQKLQDFQLELQLIDGVDTVYSLFALREPPDDSGDAAPVVSDTADGLTPDLIQRIRAHPILGDKLVSADGHAALFVVTPSEAKAPLAVTRTLARGIETTAADALAGTNLKVTTTGFSVVRAAIADIVKRDQVVLEVAGALVGTLMSLIVFRSFVASILAAFPAIVACLCVVGFMGLLGIQVTVMSTVVPALVMIFGYADGMHLCFAWRHYREAELGIAEAEQRAQKELAGACVLSALTTAIAFLSLVISSVVVVRGFGVIGAIGTMGGVMIVLILHGLITRVLGRFWNVEKTHKTNLLSRMEEPCGAIGRTAARFAWPLSAAALGLLVVLGAMYFAVNPEHQIREDLPKNNPANAALGRIDQKLGGVFPVQIIVPLHGAPPTSPQGLARIRAVHEAVAGVTGLASHPLSLWSLASWLDGPAPDLTKRLDGVLDALTPNTRKRFVSDVDATIVMVTLPELPSAETNTIATEIETAAHGAGGPDVTVTGITVVNAREGARTINSVNASILIDVIVNLGMIALAFRSIPVGIVAFLPNMLPILGIGGMLFLSGRGMQFTTAIALTVAFGIAVNDAVHYLNRFLHLASTDTLNARLIETSQHIGPVTIGSTLIIIAGLSTTLTSGMPTITLFGMITSLALFGGIVSAAFVLPALMAGPGRRWFDRLRTIKPQEADT